MALEVSVTRSKLREIISQYFWEMFCSLWECMILLVGCYMNKAPNKVKLLPFIVYCQAHISLQAYVHINYIL